MSTLRPNTPTPGTIPLPILRYNTADRVGERVIFNIKGGYYRLVTWIDYDRKLVVMKWFGTQAEYDRGEW